MSSTANVIKPISLVDEEDPGIANKQNTPTNVDESPTPLSSMPTEDTQGAQRPRSTKATSMVWNHNKKVCDTKGAEKAKCNYCGSQYACGSKKNGTSNLLNHINIQCKRFPGRGEKNQARVSFEKLKGEGANLIVKKYDYNLLSLLHNHHCNRRSIQQIHAHLLAAVAINQPPPPISLWTTILRQYSLGDSPKEALLLYKHHLHPTTLFHGDSFTLAFLLKSCANSHLPISGSQLHGTTFKFGFESHVYVQIGLVNMYVLCGCLHECQKVFDEMPERNFVTWNVLVTGLAKQGEMELAWSFFDAMPIKNVVSWSGMIGGYTRANQPKKALSLFRRMITLTNNIKPIEMTLLAVYPAIWNLGSLELCQSVQAYGEKTGLYSTDIRVTNALIDVYSRCESVNNALRVFEGITNEKRNLVSWNSLISVFAMHGMTREAVESFERMEKVGMKPDKITFLVLAAMVD